MNDIVTLIQTLGYPIVCTIAMAFYIYKEQEKSNSVIENNTKAINEQTKVMGEFSIRLDHLEEEVKDLHKCHSNE